MKQRAKVIVPLALAAFAYTQAVHLPLEQVLNGAIAAVLFNIIYDTLLSRKLRWFAMCPVIDSMNHQSTSMVGAVVSNAQIDNAPAKSVQLQSVACCVVLMFRPSGFLHDRS